MWVLRYSYLPEHYCIFWELGKDCDTTWVVVAEEFLVEEQVISSKAGVVGVGGWGCWLHLSR